MAFLSDEDILKYRKKIRDDIIENNIILKGDIILDNAGRRWKLSDWTTRAIRISVANDMLSNTMNLLEENNHDLIFCDYLSDSSELCEEFQGEVYSINGNDKNYPALDPTLWINGGGLIHPNCRHSLDPYFEDYTELPEKDKSKDISENRKAREQYLKTQRNYIKWSDAVSEQRAVGLVSQKSLLKKEEWLNRLSNMPQPDDAAFLI